MTQQIDPDLGTWVYTYNAMGNLTSRKDARCNGGSCVTINYAYDHANRLTQKGYSIPAGLNVATSTAATYFYDAGGAAAYAIGRRTSMTDGSGSTTWTYDSRGRMTQESKVISGSGTFVTQYTYNSADLPVTMRYPANASGGLGETVTTTYLPQKLVNSVIGTNTYVKSSTYDAAGRVDVRLLGDSSGAAVVKTDFDYFAWSDSNGNGRLKRIKSEDVSPLTTLQDLRYYNTSSGASFYEPWAT